MPFTGIDIDPMVLNDLKYSFISFLPEDCPHEQAGLLDPTAMKAAYERLGLDVENPSMYGMVCWMAQVNKEAGVPGIAFDEFMQQAVFFFSQRHHEDGLKSIFELFDKEKRGYLT